MNINQITKILRKIPNGVFFRITYKSEVPLASLAKKQGYSAEKITQKTVRKGVSYENISSVKIRRAFGETPKERKFPYETVIKNTLYRNIESDKLYLQFANASRGQNTQSYYIVRQNGSEVIVKPDNFKSMELVTPSYWNRQKPEVQKIHIENILDIKSKSLNK